MSQKNLLVFLGISSHDCADDALELRILGSSDTPAFLSQLTFACEECIGTSESKNTKR